MYNVGTLLLILATSFVFLLILDKCDAVNKPPVFLRDMNGLRLLENASPGSVIYQLQGVDMESRVIYGQSGGESHFFVDPMSGTVTLTSKINYEETSAFRFNVTLQDEPANGPSNIISHRIRVYIVPSVVVPVNFQETVPLTPTQDPIADSDILFDEQQMMHMHGEAITEIPYQSSAKEMVFNGEASSSSSFIDFLADFDFSTTESSNQVTTELVIPRSRTTSTDYTLEKTSLAASSNNSWGWSSSSIPTDATSISQAENTVSISNDNVSSIAMSSSTSQKEFVTEYMTSTDGSLPDLASTGLMSQTTQMLENMETFTRTFTSSSPNDTTDGNGDSTISVEEITESTSADEMLSTVSVGKTVEEIMTSMTTMEIPSTTDVVQIKNSLMTLVSSAATATGRAEVVSTTSKTTQQAQTESVSSSLDPLSNNEDSTTLAQEEQTLIYVTNTGATYSSSTAQQEPNPATTTLVPVTNKLQAPRFVPTVARVEISENWPTALPLPFRKQIYVFTPSSVDSMILQLFVVSDSAKMSSGIKTEPSFLSESGHFDILVTDSSLLDMETSGQNSLKFSIEARDLSTGLFAKLPVFVDLIDVNDRKPQFTAKGYTFHPAETMKRDDFIGMISAFDLDFGEYGTNSVEFSLFGKYSKFFKLNETKPGTLAILANPCGTEKSGRCNGIEEKVPDSVSLILRATDGKGSGKSSDVLIRVNMAKEDTYSPIFDEEFYHAWILEQTATFDPLIQIHAEDPDNSEVLYFLEDSTALFDIDNKTGILFVRHPKYVTIDNLGTRFNLIAYATDRKNPITKVNITLEVIEQRQTRNKAPFFQSDSYNFELDCMDSTVGTVSAIDTESAVKYRILEGGAGYFTVNETSGEIQYVGSVTPETKSHLIHVAAVDMETPPMLGFVDVSVTVLGLGSTVPKLLDQPVIRATIPKDSAAPMAIYTLNAVDSDPEGSLAYSIESVEAYNKDGFTIESNWTDYFAFGNGGEENGTFLLTKSLKEIDALSLHFIFVIRDAAHPREIEQNVFLVLSIQPLDDTDRFAIETLDSIMLPKSIEIPENLIPGSYVYTAVALPIVRIREGVVAYALTEGAEYFQIGYKSGIMTVIKSLDGVGAVNVTVRAFHLISGSKAMASVLVVAGAVNNHSPHFEKSLYESQVLESAKNNTNVLQAAATDEDGSSLRYRLTGMEAAYFTVDSNGTILTSDELDFERRNLLQFFLESSDDGGRISKVPVSISIQDINDNHPVFQMDTYSAGIMENSPLRSHLLQVKAEDADSGDNGAVQYTLINVPATLSSVLSIDPLDGTIRNTEPLTDLDGNYQFGAVAWDGKRQNASVPIFLSIQSTSRCYPRFTFPLSNSSVITIPENEDPGMLVTTFKATTEGLNCKLVYMIWDQDTEQYIESTHEFSVDKESGALRTRVSFDRENQSRYSLIIAAHSGILYTQSLIEFQIEDRNDNAPVFLGSRKQKFEIAEDFGVGTSLVQVSAIDPDVGAHGTVYYHMISDRDQQIDSSSAFSLGMSDGVISVRAQLDREVQETYKMWIFATNMFSPDQYTLATARKDVESRTDILEVLIRLTDVNDNGPVFDKSEHKVAASSDTPVSRLLITVHAKDPDAVDGNSIDNTVMYKASQSLYMYKNLSREVPGMVRVDSVTGEVKVAQPLATYSQGMFSVIVESADSRNKSLAQKDQTSLKIWVHNADQVVRVVVNVRPERLQWNAAEKILETVGNKIDAEVILKEVEYHVDAKGGISSEQVDLLAVFVARGTQEIMETGEVLYRVDMLGSEIKGNNDLRVYNILSASAPTWKVEDETVFSTAGIGVLVFAFTLCFGLLGFLLLLCYYRYAFVTEKQKIEEEATKPEMKLKPASPVFSSNLSMSGITQNPLWAEHSEIVSRADTRSFGEPSICQSGFTVPGSGSPPPAYSPPGFRGSHSTLELTEASKTDSGPIVIYPDKYGSVGAYYSAGDESPHFERYLEDNDTYEAMEREIR